MTMNQTDDYDELSVLKEWEQYIASTGSNLLGEHFQKFGFKSFAHQFLRTFTDLILMFE